MRTAAKQSESLNLYAKRRAPVFTLRLFFHKWVNHVHENKLRRKVILRLRTASVQPLFDRWRKNVSCFVLDLYLLIIIVGCGNLIFLF